MKSSFIGHFAPHSKALDQASSAAGNQVQRQIFEELVRACGRDGANCYAMEPQPFWPRGPLIARSIGEDGIEFIGYLNLPVIKHLVFSLRILARLLCTQPRLCVQYNSYFLENLVLLLSRWTGRTRAVAIIIQDIHISAATSWFSKRWFQSLTERASLFLCKRFDMIVPISSAIINDFRMPREKCLIFQGGITDFANQLMRSEEHLEEIAVFAGALEPHNGIDRLVSQWLTSGLPQPLHIFGRGSLAPQVQEAAQMSDRVVFHGFQPEQVVLDWQRKARWNFCLRYSVGLNQNYFFPSKLFNILCAPGVVVVNDFAALPETLREYLCIISDDFSDLAERLPEANALSNTVHVNKRREILRSKHSWRWCIDQIINRFSLI